MDSSSQQQGQESPNNMTWDEYVTQNTRSESILIHPLNGNFRHPEQRPSLWNTIQFQMGRGEPHEEFSLSSLGVVFPNNLNSEWFFDIPREKNLVYEALGWKWFFTTPGIEIIQRITFDLPLHRFYFKKLTPNENNNETGSVGLDWKKNIFSVLNRPQYRSTILLSISPNFFFQSSLFSKSFLYPNRKWERFFSGGEVSFTWMKDTSFIEKKNDYGSILFYTLGLQIFKNKFTYLSDTHSQQILTSSEPENTNVSTTSPKEEKILSKFEQGWNLVLCGTTYLMKSFGATSWIAFHNQTELIFKQPTLFRSENKITFSHNINSYQRIVIRNSFNFVGRLFSSSSFDIPPYELINIDSNDLHHTSSLLNKKYFPRSDFADGMMCTGRIFSQSTAVYSTSVSEKVTLDFCGSVTDLTDNLTTVGQNLNLITGLKTHFNFTLGVLSLCSFITLPLNSFSFSGGSSLNSTLPQRRQVTLPEMGLHLYSFQLSWTSTPLPPTTDDKNKK